MDTGAMDTVKVDSHIANRNEILLRLKKICNKNSEPHTTNSKGDSGICDTDVSQAFSEDLTRASKWSTLNFSRDVIQESDRASTTPLTCSDNVSDNKSSRTTEFEQHAEPDNDLPKNLSNPSTFSSENTRSYLRNVVKTAVIPENYVISDSQSGCPSCSDMFKDSGGSREAGNNAGEISYNGIDFINKLIAVGSLPSQIEISRCNSLSQNIISETKSDLFADDSSAEFHESCSLYQNEVGNSQEDDERLPGLSILGITQIPNLYYSQKLDSAKRGSTRDMFESDGENCFSEKESDILNLEIDGITQYQRCSLVDDLKFPTVSMDEEEWISDENREPSSLELSGESVDFVRIVQTISQDVVPFQRNSLREDNSVEDEGHMETPGKRRNLDLGDEVEALRKNEGGRVSSEGLTFTLGALDTDDIALRSMKATLSVLLNEKVAAQYMRNRCWRDTIEMRAVNAVLKFCDAFESEDKGRACMNEIIQVVTNTLDKCIGNTGQGKATILIHQVTIILELCASMGVCIEVINYLLARLKSYESSLTSLAAGKKADVHNVVNPLHIIFYSLNLCLEKYWLAVSGIDDNHHEEQTIPAIIGLWKKQFPFEGILVDESRQMRERRWEMILNDFSTIAADSFIKFTEMSRRLCNISTSKQISP